MEQIYIYLIVAAIGAFTSLGAAVFAVRADSRDARRSQSSGKSLSIECVQHPATRGTGNIIITESSQQS